MTIADWTKLIVVIGVLSSTTFLGATKVIESQAVVGLLSACLGYVFGNSHGILENKIKKGE